MKAVFDIAVVIAAGVVVMGIVCLFVAHAVSHMNENPAEPIVLVCALFVMGHLLGRIGDRAKLKRTRKGGKE